MATKGANWFMHQVLSIERAGGQLAPMAGRLMDLGLGGQDKTRGHVFQAAGAVQEFFVKHPAHKATVAASPAVPFKPTGALRQDWIGFLASKRPGAGNGRLNYSYDTLKNYLTPQFGGVRAGGGGGNNELHLALRLGADFL